MEICDIYPVEQQKEEFCIFRLELAQPKDIDILDIPRSSGRSDKPISESSGLWAQK